MSAPRRSPRAGRTVKLSISLDRADLALLRKRARRRHQGNLSAVIAEGVRRLQEEEGREALLAWLGESAIASPAEHDAIRAEWQPDARTPRRTA